MGCLTPKVCVLSLWTLVLAREGPVGPAAEAREQEA